MADPTRGVLASLLFERSPELASKRRGSAGDALAAAEAALPAGWQPAVVCLADIGANASRDRHAAGVVACCDGGLVTAQASKTVPATAWVVGWGQIDRLEIVGDSALITSGGSTWPIVPVWHAKTALFDAIRRHIRTVEAATSLTARSGGGGSLLEPLNLRVADCTVLGGYGFDLDAGVKCTLTFLPDRLEVATHDRRLELGYQSITALDISGPGRTRSNAGIAGGGFGVAGAVTGVAIAALLNSATSSESIATIVRFEGDGSELWVLVESLTPTVLRIVLSPLFVLLRSAGRQV